jgi:hypothetical protein
LCAALRLQYELYSSRVREFEVYGRQNHPRADGSDYAKSLNASAWQLLGRFLAANTKGTQVTPFLSVHASLCSMSACASAACRACSRRGLAMYPAGNLKVVLMQCLFAVRRIAGTCLF